MSYGERTAARARVGVELANPKVSHAMDWMSDFIAAWSQREPAPEILDVRGFWIWAPVLYVQHKERDPAKLAAELFGKAGEFTAYLYPALEQQTATQH